MTLRHGSKVSNLHLTLHHALLCTIMLSIFTQRLIFQRGKKSIYYYYVCMYKLYALCHQFLNYVFTAAWLSVCYMYSAIFLLIFLVSSALKMSYIYSNYFPMTCWSAICTTPSATWGGGREMHFNNENFKKTSICSSEFGWFRGFF